MDSMYVKKKKIAFKIQSTSTLVLGYLSQLEVYFFFCKFPRILCIRLLVPIMFTPNHREFKEAELVMASLVNVNINDIRL